MLLITHDDNRGGLQTIIIIVCVISKQKNQMAHSFSQNYQHIIFAVKYRNAILDIKYNNELQKYMTGLIKNRKSYLIAINNVSDHLHLLADIHRTYSVSKFVQEIKSLSSKFINEKQWYPDRFEWQTGYGSFSVSYSNRQNVIAYIQNQQKHHNIKSFHDEYLNILKQFNISINDENIFEPVI